MSGQAPILPADEPAAIARAAALLREGGIVVIPTETVYGLAANAADPRAVARVFAAKGRPRFNPLIAHVTGAEAARAQARLSARAEDLIGAFWPGPLTIVAPRRAGASVCDLACAGLATIALRAPAHAGARALLADLPFPLAAPSANRSGRLSPTAAAHAAADLGEQVDLILDGGVCRLGLESTIVAAPEEGPATILRPGAIDAAAIEAVIGPVARADPHAPVAAPGMLARHYAPRARLRLEAEAAAPGETFLGFGPAAPGEANLSPAGDLIEAAAALYGALRALDAAGAQVIAVAPIPRVGLGEAINDRLTRAAQKR